MNKSLIVLHPLKDCGMCGGTGEIQNPVPRPFGSGIVTETLSCDCLFYDIDPDTQQEIDDGENYLIGVPL